MTNMIGAILYRGPSELDGKPIVVIATGFRRSKNRKTGGMIQTWILRADVDPAEAVLTEGDASICGDCPQRRNQGGSCYVVVEQAPLMVWRTWKRGRYQDWSKEFPPGALAGKTVRLGSYGDPAAVPYATWRRVFEQKIAGWTGYTHQWKDQRFTRLRNVVMASTDTREEALQADKAGWRYFRVAHQTEPKTSGEVACPASEEMGKRTTCESCGLCQGQRKTAKSIVIQPHGYLMGRVRAKQKRLPVAVG
jgi:hypothetical protein